MTTHALRYAWSVFVAGLLASAASAQVDLYVAPGGEDGTNDCRNALHPCASVAYAIDQSTPNGDTLHVAAGTYTEPELVLNPVFHQNLRIVGAGAQTTIVQAAASPALATNRVFWVQGNSTNAIRNLTIRYGHAGDGVPSLGLGGDGENGGGVLVNGFLVLSGCRIEENSTGDGGMGGAGNGGAGGDGGGIYSDGKLFLSNCTVGANTTGAGGNSTTGTSGGRGGRGGGIDNAGGSLLLADCTISGNATGNGGDGPSGGPGGNGGVWNSGELIVETATISDNTAGDGGSGLAGSGGTGGSGAGIWQAAAGTSTVRHATIAGNLAGDGGGGSVAGGGGEGGGIYNGGGEVDLYHSIVADNAAGSGAGGDDASGILTSLGYNLVGVSDGWTLAGDTTGVQTGVDPLLGPLQDNGGATATRALSGLSPAVNGGDPSFAPPPAFDQRGSLRVQGGIIDLGAYEVASGTLYVATSGSDVTNECHVAGLPCASVGHAIDVALPGDVIAIGAGVYTESGLEIAKDLVLGGEDAASTVIQAAADAASAADRIFTVASDVTGVLQRLSLRNGHAPDGADGVASGENGGQGEDGGAIFNSGWLQIEACTIVSNKAGRGGDGEGTGGGVGGNGGQGGAVYNEGFLLLTNSLLSDNAAGDGGTGGDGSIGGEGGPGGAVANDGDMLAVLCAIARNRAGTGNFGGNQGGKGGDGGGILNNEGVWIERCEFDDNRAGAGGGGATGLPGGAGGGLFNGGNAEVVASTFANNAAGDGGAGDTDQEGEGGWGGGIYNEGDLTLASSTISGNSAGDAGSGAAAGGGNGGGVASAGTLYAWHCTITANTAGQPDGNGGGVNNGDFFSARHTIIGDNDAPGAGPDVNGDVASVGYNLIEDTSDADLIGDETGNVYGADPHLAALADNGGSTRTHLLLFGSPAINAGDPAFVPPPDFDQRGLARVQGDRIDIGAVETGYAGNDADGDGLPDDWEIAYGLDPYDNGSTNADNGAAGDPDMDGYDNLSEFIAFTVPTDNLSRFSVRGVQRTTSIAVSFLSATGRLYTLQYVDSLRAAAWSNVAGQVDVVGSGGTDTLTDPGPGPSRMYRLGVRLP